MAPAEWAALITGAIMDCLHRRYIEMGGITGSMSRVRRDELLKLHEPHHAQCRPFKPAELEALARRFTMGPVQPSACRICSDVGCDKPSCLRAILAAVEIDAFRDRLKLYAGPAVRDARAHRNGSR
jgi:hypothetical protein